MPIKPENKTRYPKDWKAIRVRILQRADDKCEQCQVPNGQLIARGQGRDAGTYMLVGGTVFCDTTGEKLGICRGTDYHSKSFTKIVLTIAHMDHALVDHSDGNLKALCQKCHLGHDRQQHIESRRKTKKESKANGDFFHA